MSQDWRYEDEWFEETNVAKKLRDYLENSGYEITEFIEDKHQQGHDIEALKDSQHLIIEVKGYPSDKYVSGEKRGQKKPTSPYLQARHWFADAVFKLLLAKSKDWNVSIALGLPDFKVYKTLLERLDKVAEKMDLICFFVNQNGNVYKEKTEEATMSFKSGDGETVKIGFINENRQICLGTRGKLGTDHLQKAYAVFCLECGQLYGSNGTDVHERNCPECQAGASGIEY